MEVANSYYTRLEQRIRTAYSTIFAFGGSLIGRMTLSFGAECIGAGACQYAANKVISEISSASSQYPLVTRPLIAFTGAVVLQGVLQGQRYRLDMRESKINWTTTLIGVMYLSATWELFADQTFPYILNINQAAARILGGYAGLVLSGVVPVFSAYVGRMVYYEGMGLVMQWALVSPQEWIPWAVFFIPRIAFCGLMQTAAYHFDRLVPFAQQCVRNIGVAKKQMIPLVIHIAIQKYAKEDQQALIENMTKTFCQGLKQSLLVLFPPLSYLAFVDKTLPTRCKQQNWVRFQRGIEQLVSSGIRRGMRTGVSKGVEHIEENSQVLVHWGLRTILLFGRLLDTFPRIKALHREWKAAFLEGRDNDREITRRLIVDAMNQVMERRYGAGDDMKSQTIQLLCKSKRLMNAILEGMQEIPKLEKELIGCALTQESHVRYWRATCEIYLPYFVTLAVHHYGERSQAPSLLEEKELIEQIEALVCHAYIDVVLPQALSPWMRKVVQHGVRSVCALQEMAMHLACAPEQQTWVPREEGVEKTMTERVKEAHFASLQKGEEVPEEELELEFMAEVPQLTFAESEGKEEDYDYVAESETALVVHRPDHDPNLDLDEWVCVPAQST